MTTGDSSQRCDWVPQNNKAYQEYHDQEWGGGGSPAIPKSKAFQARYDGERLFELICLEGQQAGLSWWTVLQKRDAYRRTFHAFVPTRVARMDPLRCISPLLTSTAAGKDRVIAHRGKLESVIDNAQAYERLTAACLREHGVTQPSREQASSAFAAFLWSFSYLPFVADDAAQQPRPLTRKHCPLHFYPSPFVTSRAGGRLRVDRRKTPATVRTQSAASEALSKALKKAGFRFFGATTCYAFMQACGMINDHTGGCDALLPCEAWRREVWRRDCDAMAHTPGDAATSPQITTTLDDLMRIATSARAPAKDTATSHTHQTQRKRQRGSNAAQSTTKRRRTAES